MLLRLQQDKKPAIMGNLSVMDSNPTSQERWTKDTITHIGTISTTNLTLGKQVATGYVKLAAKIEECQEHKVDEELTRKAQDSQRIKWDHRTITKQKAKLEKLAQKDPELGLQKLQEYKLECQKVACKEGRLPQNSGVTVKPSDPLENQEANALHIPMHAQTKLGTHVLPALIDTGATQNFLSESAAKQLSLIWKEDDTPKPVTNADGSKCGSGMITQYCNIPMKLDNLWKEEWFYKAKTGTDQVVLGIPWPSGTHYLWVARLDDGTELKVTDPKEQQGDVEEEEAKGKERRDCIVRGGGC